MMGSAASTTMSLPQSNKPVEEDTLELNSFGFNPSYKPAQEIVKSISETTEQYGNEENLQFEEDNMTLNEFKKLLQQLNLSSNEIKSKTTLFKENSKLHEVLMLASMIVVNLYEANHSVTNIFNLFQKLDSFYHEIELEDRKIIGDYLASIKFTKESFKTYQTILKKEDLGSFDDRLLNGEISVEKQQVLIVYLIRGLWWNFSDVSCDFCFKLAEDGVIKELVKDLKKLIGKKEDQLKDSFCFESCMGVLHNAAKNDNLRSLYRQYKVVDILGKFFIYENLSKVMMLVLITLALIIDENQTHLLTSNETVFDLILSILKSSLRNKEHRFDGFSTQELLVSLTKLCRNDEVKRVLVKKNVLDLVLSVLNDGKLDEKEWAAKLLWELSFAQENEIKITENEPLMTTVRTLTTHSNHHIAKACQGVILSISKEKLHSKDKQTSSNTKKTEHQQGHIMISYSWANQKVLIQIRDALKSHGYATWMDIDNIAGSTVDAMAEAVEKCEVFLMCMSENYKESTSCRAEADYAFKKMKPIIPLLMQNKYVPDGWLGFLLGSKIFYEFTGKYDFNSKLAELIREIGNRGKITVKDEGDFVVATFHQPLSTLPHAAGQKFHVDDWIVENKLSELAHIHKLSCENLLFLKNVSFRAPEFYFTLILDLISGKMTAKELTSLMLVHTAIERIKI